jgi:glycosyltransferase involved in cell wall biosynthesis
LHSRYSNIKIIIAGECAEGSFKEELLTYRQLLGDSVSFCMKRIEDDEVQYYFNSADAVVYAFKQITTSGSVLLGLSFQKLIIYPEIGGLKDVPINIGIAYSSLDKDGLMHAMEAAILHPDMIHEMQRTIKKYIESISWDRISDQTFDVFNNLLKDTE